MVKISPSPQLVLDALGVNIMELGKKLDAWEVIVIELGLEVDAPQVWAIDLLDLNVLGSWLPTSIAVLDWPKIEGAPHTSLEINIAYKNNLYLKFKGSLEEVMVF